ncbi:MAG: hypothetical protein ACI89Z_000716 [Porticoccus sp.]|jgi:hypothetical protein
MEKKKDLSLATNTVLARSLLLGTAAATASEPGGIIVRVSAANIDLNDESSSLKLNGTSLAGSGAEV